MTDPSTPVVDDEGRGVWRDGGLVVLSRYARLPSRCLKCNAPATSRPARRLTWHRPALYFWLFAGMVPYLIVAAIKRKTAVVEVPTCDRHRSIRVWKIRLALAIIAGSLLLTAVGASNLDEYTFLLPVASVTVLLGAFYGALASRPVKVKRIDETHVWLKGVCPEYLSGLASLPMLATVAGFFSPSAGLAASIDPRPASTNLPRETRP